MKMNFLFYAICKIIAKSSFVDMKECSNDNLSSTENNAPFQPLVRYTKGNTQGSCSLKSLGFEFTYNKGELETYTYKAPSKIYSNFDTLEISLTYKNTQEQKVALLNLKTSTNIKLLNCSVFSFDLSLRRSNEPYVIEISNVTDFEFDESNCSNPKSPKLIVVGSTYIPEKHVTKILLNNSVFSDVVFDHVAQSEESKQKVIADLSKRIKDMLTPTPCDLKNDFKTLARIVVSDELRDKMRCPYRECDEDYMCPEYCYDEWLKETIIYIRNRNYFEVYLTDYERSRLGCHENIVLCPDEHECIPNKRKYRIYYDDKCKDPEYKCLEKIADELAKKYENDCILGKYKNVVPKNSIYYPNGRENARECKSALVANQTLLDESIKGGDQNQAADCGYYNNKQQNGMYQGPYCHQNSDYGYKTAPQPCYQQGNVCTGSLEHPTSTTIPKYAQTSCSGYIGQAKTSPASGAQLSGDRNRFYDVVKCFVKDVLKVGLLSQQCFDLDGEKNALHQQRAIDFLDKTKEVKDLGFLRYFLEVLCLCDIKYSYPEYKALKNLDNYPSNTLFDSKKALYYATKAPEVFRKVLEQTGASLTTLVQNYPSIAATLYPYYNTNGFETRASILPDQYDASTVQRDNLSAQTQPQYNGAGMLLQSQGAQRSNEAQTYNNTRINGISANQYILSPNEQQPFYVQLAGSYPEQRLFAQNCQAYNQQDTPQQVAKKVRFADNTGMTGTRSPTYGMISGSNRLSTLANQQKTPVAMNAALRTPGSQPINVTGFTAQGINATPVAGQVTTGLANSTCTAPKTSTIVPQPVTGEQQKETKDVEALDEEDEELDVSEESSSDTLVAKKPMPEKKKKISPGAIVAIALTVASILVVLAGAGYYFLM